MKIYTGQTSGDTLKQVIGLDMGIMISSSPSSLPSKEIAKTYCALDNGAFTCYRKGYPFMEDVFLKTIQDAYKKNIALDFIVTPDIIEGGEESLSFSRIWSQNQLATAPRLALVLQDGMKFSGLGSLKRFTHLFVGGSVDWKWKTADEWVKVARGEGKQIHIGQCGRFEYLMRAHELQVDSVDSTSFVVNQSFHIVQRFYDAIGKKNERNQLYLFGEVG